MHIYSQRDLSIGGKILITKTFGISKLFHALSIVESNKTFLAKIQSEYNRYIWGYKPSKVKHNVLIGTYEHGGLASIDIESKYQALRLPWLERILNGKG